MCLAVPARIVSIEGGNATIELNGIRQQASLQLIDEAVVGDYVLVHVGFALERIDPEEARRTLALFAEMRSEPRATET